MKNNPLETGLLVYSLVVSTVLLLTFGVTAPSLTSLLTVALLFPLVLYFWIRVTNPVKTSADVWSLRFMIVLAMLIGLGVGARYLEKRNQTLAAQTQPDTASVQKIAELEQQLQQAQTRSKEESKISDDLSGIKKELISLKNRVDTGEIQADYLAGINELLQATLSATLRDVPLGFVRIKESRSTTVWIQGEPNSASVKIVEMTPNTDYPFYSKEGTWYFISMSDTEKGWVDAQAVQELPNTW